MPAIGKFNFEFKDGYDSGIVLQLVKSPEKEINFSYAGCQIVASPSLPVVICRFTGAASSKDAFEKGSYLTQEALDVLSIRGLADLITSNSENDHLLWWKNDHKCILLWVSTTTFTFRVGPVTLTVRDPLGKIIPPIPFIPIPHLGFRYYRLAQTSEDLYDAYRNMYLAFESLLSSRYSKAKGKEIDWLYNSLSSVSADLALANLVSPTSLDSIADILSVIYTGARLPLFHAKDGKAYFAPVHSSADREVVTKALNMLTQIVLRMADTWYSIHHYSGGVNLQLMEIQYRPIFAGSHFVFSDNPDFTFKDDINSDTIKNGVAFHAVYNDHFGIEIKHNIFGEVTVSQLASRGSLHALYLVNDVSMLVGLSPDTTIDLTGFDDFQVLLFVRSLNANTPKYVYPR